MNLITFEKPLLKLDFKIILIFKTWVLLRVVFYQYCVLFNFQL